MAEYQPFDPDIFEKKSEVDLAGQSLMRPWAASRKIQLTDMPKSYHMQALGDFWATGIGPFRNRVELKTERKHTGNLFLEVWSNRAAGRLGWWHTAAYDVFWYIFLDRKVMYKCHFPELRYKTGMQSILKEGGPVKWRKCVCPQKNDSWGWCLPVTWCRDNLESWKEHDLKVLAPAHAS